MIANKYYDPKLSEAGIMDLVVALAKQIETPDSRAIVERMPKARRDAVALLLAACRHYVDTIEGRKKEYQDYDDDAGYYDEDSIATDKY